MQRIKGCRRRLHYPEKLTFAGLRTVRLMGRRHQTSPVLFLKLQIRMKADFFGGGGEGGLPMIAFCSVPMPSANSCGMPYARITRTEATRRRTARRRRKLQWHAGH